MSMNSTICKFETIQELADRLRDDVNNIQFVLLFAYNRTGKTRLSMAFKDKGKTREGVDRDTLYFNAYTEDLFSWNNDLQGDSERYLKINSVSQFFVSFQELALEEKIYQYLGRYADFDFRIDYVDWRVVFSKDDSECIKISRGEENVFIWCVYLAIVQLAIDNSSLYNWVEYLFIDDPISSLDDNNAIAVASDLAKLLLSAEKKLKVVVSSHHGLFYNVLCNEIKKEKHKKYFLHLDRAEGIHTLQPITDKPFFNHIATLTEIKRAAEKNDLYTYHFNSLRIILEKTAAFFGQNDISYCLDSSDKQLHARALNLLSHGGYQIYQPTAMVEDNKVLFKNILDNFLTRYDFDLPKILAS